MMTGKTGRSGYTLIASSCFAGMQHMKHSSYPLSPIPDGEIVGSILIGLVNAFKNIQAISGDVATHLVEGVVSTGWYPMANFFGVLDEVCHHDVDYAPILFRAGVAFVEDWYWNGGGKTVAPGVADFLRMQGSNGGYSSVHRGDPSTIGWQELIELDESAGHATIVCINPYPKEFECGVFHGGMLMTDEVQYAHVESVEEPYNCHLNKKTHRLLFRRKPDQRTQDQLDALLAAMTPEKPVAFSVPLGEALAWRLKGVQEQYRSDLLFYQQSSLLLSKAAAEIHELSRKLDKLAHHDELTGLLNRRAAFERAKGLLALGARHDRPTAFVMIDIDHFKSINDRWGHSVGDQTIRSVGGLLRSRLRDSDLLGRIGGEEFLVVLPDSDLGGASRLAESLRVDVADHVHLVAADQQIPVTISLGIAVAEGRHGGEIETYIWQADQALYRSKRSGRNRVTCYQH